LEFNLVFKFYTAFLGIYIARDGNSLIKTRQPPKVGPTYKAN